MSGLILETSTEKGILVLAVEGDPIDCQPLAGGPALSKSLALEAQRILQKNSFHPQYIAVGTGPGSYTGIRVGAALAKALAYGWQIPLFGFCSLEAFTALDELPEQAASCPVLVDARMGGFFVLKGRRPSLFTVALAEIELRGAPLLASPHPETIQKRLSLPCRWIETSPDPKILATLAFGLFNEGKPEPLTLSYLSSP